MGQTPAIQVNDRYFKDIDTEQKAYWLGYVYADGYSAQKAPWTMVIQTKDIDHLHALSTTLEYTGTIKTVNGSGYNKNALHGRLVVCRKTMCNDLNNWGRNEKVMTLPKIDPSLMRHFIRGYFDGDGSIYMSKSTVKTAGNTRTTYSYLHVQIIGTKPFLQEIADLLLAEGITSYWKDSKTSYMKYLNISGGHNLRKLHSYLYDASTIQLPRKAQKWEALYAHSHRDV